MSDPKAYPAIVFMLDNASGSPTAIESYIDAQAGFQPEAETKRYSYTPMSTGDEVEVGGSRKKRFTLQAFDIPEAATFFEAIRGKSGLDYEIRHEGTGAGKRKVTGTCTCVHVGVFGGAFDGIRTVPVEFSIQTGPTEGTQS